MLPFLRGCLVAVLLIANTLFWFVPIILLSLLKRLMPLAGARRVLSRANDA